MSDQKNIDNFFKESFENFEVSPDPALWDKISDKLDSKEAERKKEGIIFLPWLYKAAGIAAAIALLFFVGNEFMNSDGTGIGSDEQTTSTTKNGSLDTNANGKTTNSQVTDSNTNSEENLSNDQQNSSDGTLQNGERIANENSVDNNGNHQQNGDDNSVQKGNALQNAVASQNGTNTNSNSKNDSQQSSNNRMHTNSVQDKNIVNQENTVATSNSTQNKNNTASNSTSQNSVNNTGITTNTVANSVAQNTNSSTNNTNATKNGVQNGVNGSATNSNTVANSNSTAVAQNDSNNTTNSNSSNTNSETSTTATTDVIDTETAVTEVKKDDEIKKSLLDVINELHDLEEDKTEVAEATPKKWTVSPNASPVYYNTLSNGSPIDETFADNTKTGDVNFSYGVNVGYDVSKRLTVRSGIHKVDYSYSTRDIALVPSINGTELTTIQFKGNNTSLDIKDRQVVSNDNVAAFSQYQLPSTESSIQQKQIEGNLSQRMSYIEVPVELKYAVLDKKLGINVIGGVSTLLLTENSIVLDSPEVLTEIGEATNVNNVSFSTNIGLGIDYKISKQVEFNLEPMLKYQLNTFSGNTGNFKPYSVGVYTGVSFRF